METPERGGPGIAIPGEDLQHHDTLLPEARFNIEQVHEAPEEETGSRHQDQRERHLDGDQSQSQASLSGIGGHGSQARLLKAGS